MTSDTEPRPPAHDAAAIAEIALSALERAVHILGVVANYSDAARNGGEYADYHARDMQAMNGDVIAEDMRTLRELRAHISQAKGE